jgi:hypothetical protein
MGLQMLLLLHTQAACTLHSQAARPSSQRGLAALAEPVWDYCEAPLLPSTYIINTTAATWQEAEESCKSYGGHLVSFMDQTEQVGHAHCSL